MLSSLTLFDDFFDYRKPSIYVVSDAQLSAWKRTQAENEIIQLDQLIDSHKQSIERLQATRDQLRKDYPVPESSTNETTTENG
jgi:hypothetical protein